MAEQDCGCSIYSGELQQQGTDIVLGYSIRYCPMHKAAPEMLKALVWGMNDYDNDVPLGGACVEAQRKALAAARSQEAGG